VPAFTITSPAFQNEQPIPAKYTSDGPDVSPPLVWQGIPEGTKSLALIVDDPDAPDPKAPKTTWVHWVLTDIPPTETGLPEAAPPPSGAHVGINDWKKAAWGGPAPPIGRHRYFFKLYALDTTLPQLKSPTKAELEQAMRGHVLAETQLMGTYQKA
jgi:Raf kinase inhibitor-like YbhB/YbcL family protein